MFAKDELSLRSQRRAGKLTA
ncbi:Protein of unknown function [Pyronema omphalodes CBS 100304]|uniref:Uncharacterized protein n=1 Tax=Pyronema omphalodes (strain CBS 100304) TaxID=1076935 RepID=U4LQ16_PYROM|nr:Protein of unknown function [Pyronema omphalodes CBS 100304]